jgi:hypothetical protein
MFVSDRVPYWHKLEPELEGIAAFSLLGRRKPYGLQ